MKTHYSQTYRENGVRVFEYGPIEDLTLKPLQILHKHKNLYNAKLSYMALVKHFTK